MEFIKKHFWTLCLTIVAIANAILLIRLGNIIGLLWLLLPVIAYNTAKSKKAEEREEFRMEMKDDKYFEELIKRNQSIHPEKESDYDKNI